MPHFGLMETKESFDSSGGALYRARLHIRGGKRRLREGKISAGIVTLYDALIFGLRYYLTVPDHRKELDPAGELDLTDERSMIDALRRHGTLASSFDINDFEVLVEKASNEEMPGYDYAPLLRSFERLMTDIEVMPFDESALPPEDPSTF